MQWDHTKAGRIYDIVDEMGLSTVTREAFDELKRRDTLSKAANEITVALTYHEIEALIFTLTDVENMETADPINDYPIIVEVRNKLCDLLGWKR